MREVRSPLHQALGRILHESRKGCALTQIQVAQALNRQQSYVAEAEQGRQLIEVADLISFCGVVNLDPAEALRRAVRDAEQQ